MSADCIRAICFNITTVNSTAETGYAGKIRLMLVLRQVNTGHSTFHWDANIKRFGVGKQPQIPVFFALIRALTSTLSPAMLVSNSWNLLLNRSFIKKKKKGLRFTNQLPAFKLKINILEKPSDPFALRSQDPVHTTCLLLPLPLTPSLLYHHLQT